ncbi:hypothetical protein [Saccharopolyspora phatthalungensis]|uniref:Uncharacterized protein n=1 Tax=Saccharopolyspora phatthalungensis TaxID=664693 RepID=A0A840PZI1_9PSEU|nr:hypothetical protein [Saccharopolyspora phatthalungensis]MBB5153696.1 hypothetical protein [Saccharopolyspora phatthalungensis]
MLIYLANDRQPRMVLAVIAQDTRARRFFVLTGRLPTCACSMCACVGQR